MGGGDVVDLALLTAIGQIGSGADLLAQILSDCPMLYDELCMAQARAEALVAEIEQVLTGRLNGERRKQAANRP